MERPRENTLSETLLRELNGKPTDLAKLILLLAEHGPIEYHELHRKVEELATRGHFKLYFSPKDIIVGVQLGARLSGHLNHALKILEGRGLIENHSGVITPTEACRRQALLLREKQEV